jgi:putative RecB family exonuclease
LSYSSISSYLLCPRAWRFHYLDQIETPTSPALIFGSAFHNALEDYIGHTALEEDFPLLGYWNRSWAAQLERNAENGIAWGKDSQESMTALGVKMFSDPDTVALVDSLQPLVIKEQVQIERKISLTVPGVPIPIIGYIDMIEQDGVPADFKTSGKSWNQRQADSEMQPCFYLAALNQSNHPLVCTDPSEEMAFYFRHYVFVKTKTPKVQIWESTRTIQDLFWLFGLITDVWKGIKAEVFPPNPRTWKCSSKYCDFWGICRGAQ